MDTIKQKAETFTLSYKSAMELTLTSTPTQTTTSSSMTLESCAKALASHYAPKMYSFVSGKATVLPDGVGPGTATTMHEELVARRMFPFSLLSPAIVQSIASIHIPQTQTHTLSIREREREKEKEGRKRENERKRKRKRKRQY